MDGLEEKMGQILSDPNAMAQIMQLAQNLGMGQQTTSEPQTQQASAPPPQAIPGMPDPGQLMGMITALSGQGTDPRQAALVKALKPLVSPERAAKLDRAMEAAKMAQMAEVVLRQMQQRQV